MGLFDGFGVRLALGVLGQRPVEQPPPDASTHRLVRLAKIRWRVEHDYREMKHGLGLAHFERRTWRGWHHHGTRVTAAHAFLTLRRLATRTSGAAECTRRGCRWSAVAYFGAVGWGRLCVLYTRAGVKEQAVSRSQAAVRWASVNMRCLRGVHCFT